MMAVGLALALLIAGQSSPIQTPPPAPETAVEDVVVDGLTLEQRTRRFVDEVARPAPGRGLARWQRPVCVGVVNFRGATARLIADTIATTASDLGVAVADAPCEPNLFIVGAEDGRALAQAWVAARPSDFRWNVTGSHDDDASLTRFETSDDPVRWWHVSMPMYFDIFTGRADPAVRLPGGGYPQIRVYAKSQLRGRTRDDLIRTGVIVDVGMAERLTIQQLCDYLVMVAFAQVDPQADMAAYPTILNVFDSPTTVQGLTGWDRAYLSALYEADETARLNPHEQAASLAAGLTAPDVQ